MRALLEGALPSADLVAEVFPHRPPLPIPLRVDLESDWLSVPTMHVLGLFHIWCMECQVYGRVVRTRKDIGRNGKPAFR